MSRQHQALISILIGQSFLKEKIKHQLRRSGEMQIC